MGLEANREEEESVWGGVQRGCRMKEGQCKKR